MFKANKVTGPLPCEIQAQGMNYSSIGIFSKDDEREENCLLLLGGPRCLISFHACYSRYVMGFGGVENQKMLRAEVTERRLSVQLLEAVKTSSNG